jgi:hypothetical protein
VRASLHPITRETRRDDGEMIRQFDVISSIYVLGAFLGAVFLVLFLAAFLPWVLVKGTTAAVEGLMSRIGFGDFTADTIWSWLLVLVVGAAFVAFLVAMLAGILVLYNVLAGRTGYGLRMRADPDQRAIATTPAAALPPSPRDREVEEDETFDELYAEAQQRGLPGRSSMSKSELQAALRRKRRPRKTTTTRRRR